MVRGKGGWPLVAVISVIANMILASVMPSRLTGVGVMVSIIGMVLVMWWDTNAALPAPRETYDFTDGKDRTMLWLETPPTFRPIREINGQPYWSEMVNIVFDRPECGKERAIRCGECGAQVLESFIQRHWDGLCDGVRPSI